MQTRSQTRTTQMKRREEMYVVPVRQRMVTRSMAREKQDSSKKETQRLWFVAYIKKSLESIVQTNVKDTNSKEKFMEKVRIVDEMFYTVKMYIADIAEHDDKMKRRLIPVMSNKSNELTWQIYNELVSKGNDCPMYFTVNEYRYLQNVMKNLRNTGLYLDNLLYKWAGF